MVGSESASGSGYDPGWASSAGWSCSSSASCLLALAVAALPRMSAVWAQVQRLHVGQVDPVVEMVLFGVAGLALVALAIFGLNRTLVSAFRRGNQTEVADVVYRHRQRQRGPKVVAIGGGHGLNTLLRGLKEHTDNITAIVTVADDGGIQRPVAPRPRHAAPGRFSQLPGRALRVGRAGFPAVPVPFRRGHRSRRPQLRQPVPDRNDRDHGQLRSGARRVEPGAGGARPGHAVDAGPGDPGGRSAGKRRVWRARRRPTLTHVRGESNIGHAAGRIQRVYLQPEDPPAYPEAIRAVLDADLIVIGPGSLYTSVLPNLLVPDLCAALESAQALKSLCVQRRHPGGRDGRL